MSKKDSDDFYKKWGQFLRNYEKQKVRRPKYYLGKEFPNIYLTQREADCGVLMLKRLNNREIAAVLGLSDRTIEFYINNIKTKLRVRKRIDVLRLLMMSDLSRSYRGNLLEELERS